MTEHHAVWCGREEPHEHDVGETFREAVEIRGELNGIEQTYADQLAAAYREALEEFAPASLDEAFALGVLWSVNRFADRVVESLKKADVNWTWLCTRYVHATSVTAADEVRKGTADLSALEEEFDAESPTEGTGAAEGEGRDEPLPPREEG